MSKLHVVTVASLPNKTLAQLVDSCEQNGITLEILGMGLPFHYLADKLKHVWNYVKTCQKDDVVLFVDAYDVLLLASPSEILEKFYSLKAPFIVSAETRCYPLKEVASQYPPSPTAFKYINTGAFIGYAGYIKELFDELSPFELDGAEKNDDQAIMTLHYLKNREKYLLDTRCDLFINSFLLTDQQLTVDDSAKRVTFVETGKKPCVLHGNGHSPWYPQLYNRFFAKEYIKNNAPKATKSIFLTILARDDSLYLQKYLRCIEEQDYDKKLITIYIATHNNSDDTTFLLNFWAEQNRGKYADIIFEAGDLEDALPLNPYIWLPSRFKIDPRVRNYSLQKAKGAACDFACIADVDTFITPCTLRELVARDKPIIAPLLGNIPGSDPICSNYFAEIKEDGSYKDSLEYFKILIGVERACFKVPCLFGCCLIKTYYLNSLTYTNASQEYAYVAFSRSARQNQIDQYISNEKEYGVMLHFHEFPPKEAEAAKLQQFLTM